jgi:membrane protease YdiL (CAAX protease family)
MTITEEVQSERGLLAQIFISPEEPRLRAGWRLLVHTILLIVALIAVTLIVVVLGLILTGGDTIALQRFDPEGTGVMLAGIVFEVLIFTAVTWVARRFLDRRSFVSLGLHPDRNSLLDVLFGIAVGAVLMGLIYAFESAAGWLTFEAWAWDEFATSTVLTRLLAALLLYLGVGYSEELLSRGYHLQTLWTGLKLPLALLISSGVFAALHLGNPSASWVSTLGIFFAGIFLAYGYLRTSELWIPIGVHIGWNFFQGTIFGFPVSGTGGFHLIRQTVEGPDIITGGLFGPEAGMISWVAMLLGAGMIWAYTRGRTPAVQDTAPAPTPAVDSSLITQNS